MGLKQKILYFIVFGGHLDSYVLWMGWSILTILFSSNSWKDHTSTITVGYKIKYQTWSFTVWDSSLGLPLQLIVYSRNDPTAKPCDFSEQMLVTVLYSLQPSSWVYDLIITLQRVKQYNIYQTSLSSALLSWFCLRRYYQSYAPFPAPDLFNQWANGGDHFHTTYKLRILVWKREKKKKTEYKKWSTDFNQRKQTTGMKTPWD